MKKTIWKYNLWEVMIIKIILLAIKLFYKRTVSVLRNKRGESHFPMVTIIEMGKSIYKIGSYFKKDSTTTMSDKLLRLMEFELEKENSPCYNGYNTNSQIVPQRNAAAVGGFCEAKLLKSLDCKPERSIV